MRRWMMLGLTLAACAAHAQSAPTASDSWQRPAASSSAAYAGTPATTSRDSHGAFRFKGDDKSEPSRFRVEGATQQRKPGQAPSFCAASNAACQQAQTRPGQGR